MDFNRSTTGASLLAIANIVCRGGTRDWRELYRELDTKPEMRPLAEKALLVADTEAFPGSIILFQEAIESMNAADARDNLPGRAPQVGSSSTFRKAREKHA